MYNSKSITYQHLVCTYDMTFAEPQNPCSSESLKYPDWWDNTWQWLNNCTVRWREKLWTVCWLSSIFLESTINFIFQNWLPISYHITKFQDKHVYSSHSCKQPFHVTWHVLLTKIHVVLFLFKNYTQEYFT